MNARGMKAKHQRLMLVLLLVAALIGSAALAASALRDQASYFYTPSDVAAKGVPAGKAVRLGGMVPTGSIQHLADGVTIDFKVTDGKATVPVIFKGIAPDLFREGSGVVADGRFRKDGTFIASDLLAKHDENYMPRELKGMRYDEASHEMKAAR